MKFRVFDNESFSWIVANSPEESVIEFLEGEK